MKKLLLDKNWQVTGRKIGTLEAVVPGCIHTDLLRCGKIEDPFWRDHDEKYRWIEDEDFTYTCTFDAEPSDDAVLVFEGLDTYCEVYLNGQHLGGTHNMFISHEFPAGGLLKKTGNILTVAFRSPIKEVKDLPLRKAAFTQERINTRRMQCTYGWDWVARYVTCGIYRPAYIRYGSDMYVDTAYIVTENMDSYSAQIRVELTLKNYEVGGLLHVEVLSPKGEAVLHDDMFSREETVVRRYDIENPELWYPLGYGEHPIYTLRVTAGENLFEDTFGIRTVKLMQLTDKPGSKEEALCKALREDEIFAIRDHNEVGSSFQIVINGVKVLALGGNWVPCEPFPSEETPDRIRPLIQRAVDMGMNTLRIWGGGHFENRFLFDECDRQGIMVTHDFLMACGQYPEKEQWFIDELRKEAEYCVKLVRNHPSLLWYSGDNELGAHGSDTMEDYKGRSAAMEASAPAVYRFDPYRQFMPSSPFGGSEFCSPTVATTHNTLFLKHTYNFFNHTDCSFYKEFLNRFNGRFVAEEPIFAMANTPALLRCMTQEDLEDPKESMLEHHTKNHPALEVPIFTAITNFAKKVMGQPESTEMRLFEYRYIGYEWARVVMERLRKHLGFTTGLIFWMYNDCWPASLSWSFVDYYGAPKSSFYAFRRCAKPAVLAVSQENGKYTVTLSGTRDVTAKVTARLLKKSEGFKTIATQELTLSADAFSTTEAELDFASQEDCVLVCDGGSDRTFYAHDRLFMKDCTDALEILEQNDGSVTLRAKTYIHAVELDTDKLLSDNYFSLLPGEEKTVTWDGGSDMKIRAYTLV